MGARFYEGTMPKIAEQLERLNDNLEALIFELLLQQDRHRADAGAPASSASRQSDLGYGWRC